MKAFAAGLALLTALVTTPVVAQNTYSVYLDAAGHHNSGCNIVLPGGTFSNADTRLQAAVTPGNSPQVTSVTLSRCVGGVWQPSTVIGGGYPVDLNMGVSGSDSIEISTPIAGIVTPDNPLLRMGFTAQNATGSDVLFTVDGSAGGAPIVFGGAVIPIPTLGFGALALLALLLALIARRHGRNKLYSRILAASFVAFTGVAGAAWVLFDWTGISPIATDPTGDSTNGSPDIDIRAGFVAFKAGTIYFRIDVVDVQTTPPQITSANNTTFYVGKPGTFTVTSTGIPTPTLSISGCTLPTGVTFVNNGNGTATLAGTPAAGTANTYNCTITANNGVAPNATQAFTLTVANAPSQTALVSGTNPSVFGQSVTFTATVTPAPGGSGTPTGTVTFLDGATTLGTGTLNGSGVATFSTGSLSVASHSITAQYGGDVNFGTSTSPVVTQVVNQAASSTAIASSANPSVFGQSVTFTATVTVTAPGAGTATGTVTFKDGATTLGTGTLNGSGVATFATSSLAVGNTHSITAVYGGDTNVTGSTSTALTQVVNQDPTTTALASSVNPSVFGQSVTFTATVTANAPGAGTPTGTVTFKDGATTLGTGTLNGSGVTTFATGSLSVATHSITAVYAGDTNFATSTSTTLSQVVNPGATNTALAASPNPSVVNQSVTFTATVTAVSPAVGTPTGTVNFVDGGSTTIGSGVLNGSGVATFSTSSLSQGTHSITAVYVASTNFASSTSTAVSQVVNMAATTTAVTSNANPALAGANVTFTATVTVTPPGSGTPTGNVTFKDGAATLGTGALNGSAQATFSSTTLTAGTHSITAVYAGDPNFSGSTSPALTQTINQAPAITSANSTVFNPGVAGTFTVTTTGFPTGASMVITETGALPGGVTFTNNNDGTATIAGTAATGGDFPIVITANNGIAPNATQNFTLHVQAAPQITSANTVTFIAGTVGTDFIVTTTGTPTPTLSESGALPTGVTFVDNGNGTATLKNSPAAGTGGSYAITITAANGILPNATQNFTLVVNQAPAITSLASTTFVVGSAGTFNVTTSGFPTGASMSITEVGALPTGVTFVNNNNGTATLSGTPAAGTGGSYPFVITANNGVAPNATQNFTLTVQQAPTITSANTTTFTVGQAGTFSVTATGTPQAMTLSESGALPGGVTFVDNGNGSATLAGTPAAGTGGSYALTITANNGVAPNATQSFTLIVDQAPAITSANNTTFKVGTAGTFTVTTTGFPTNASMAITETGALPSGVTFVNNNNGTATLAGTPAAGTGGSYPITITANNGVAPNATQSFTLSVQQAPIITSANTTTFTVGQAGTFAVTATGTPQAMTLSESGALPGGVTFVDNGNGNATLAGTPAAGTGGSYAITITANNGVTPNATQSFTLLVNQAPAITSANNTTFKVGTAGTFTVTTTGFPTNASMNITETGALPSGVTFVNNNNGTATLAGTPAAGTGGVYTLSLSADNGVGSPATQTFTLTVNDAPAITSANTTTFTVGQAGTFTVTTTGFPTNASMVISESGALPGGVTFVNNNNGTATLAGTPAAGTGGSYALTITANNGVTPNATQSFTLIVDQAPAITSANTTTFTPGVAGTFTVTTTGFPTNASMAIAESGALPSGVTFVNNNNGTATLAGTPAALTQNASPYALTITANNGVAPSASQGFTLNVVCPVITVSGTLADQTYNTAMTATTFTQSGGHGAISWTASGLAPGDTIGGASGQVTGTPTNTGTFPTTITATDAFGCSGSTTFTYHVDPGASNDNYNALGNVIVNSASVPFSVADNDLFPAGTTISAFDATSVGGGTVTMTTTAGATLGQFTYDPPVGKGSGTDTFTYTLSSNGRTAVGTVTFTVTGRVWFIDSASSCSSTCDGRKSHPFTTTSAFSTANTGAAGKPAANDPIFVYTGSGNYSGAITLLNGQRLIGQGAVSPLTTLASVTPQSGQTLPATGGTQPTLTSTGVTLTVGSGNFLHGLLLGNATTTALSGNNFGTLTVNDNVTINTNGQAMNLNNGTLTATFEGVTSGGGATNITLVSVGGTSNFSNSINGTLSGAAGVGFAIGSGVAGSGGTATITYGGNITGSLGQPPIVFQNRTAGTVTLNGNVTATAGGVQLLNNTGATTAFTGVLTLNTGAATAFTATGGGTVSATNTASVLSTTGVPALNVANTTISSSNLVFKSVASSTSTTNGIVLNNTGTTGTLQVLGTGAAGSGGTISSSTAEAVLITSASAELDSMTITNPGTHGISATTARNLIIKALSFTDAAGNVANDDGIHAINTTNLLQILNCSIAGARHQGITVDNNNQSMATLSIDGTSVTGTPGGDGVLIQMRGTSVLTTGTIGTVAANTFSNNSATGLQINNADTGNMTSMTISGNTINANNAGIDLDIAQAASMNVTVQNNTITRSNSQALNLVQSTTATGGQMRALLKSNNIGLSGGVLDSGSAIGNGIRVANGALNVAVTIDSNVIREVPNGRGISIEAQAYAGGGNLKAKIVNNQVIRPTGTNQNIGCGANTPCPLASLFVLSDNNGGPANNVCTVVSGNTLYDPTSWPVGGEAAVYYARRTTATNILRLEGTQASLVPQITTTNTISNLTTAPGVIDENAAGTTAIVAAGTCGTFP